MAPGLPKEGQEGEPLAKQEPNEDEGKTEEGRRGQAKEVAEPEPRQGKARRLGEPEKRVEQVPAARFGGVQEEGPEAQHDTGRERRPGRTEAER